MPRPIANAWRIPICWRTATTPSSPAAPIRTHSRGATNFVYGPGRYRPDLVVGRRPSHQRRHGADQLGGRRASRRRAGHATPIAARPIKAILMAGATKTEFAGFVEPSTGRRQSLEPATLRTDRTPTRPLDDIFGAGELNIFNSYLMTVGGRTPAAPPQPADGRQLLRLGLPGSQDRLGRRRHLLQLRGARRQHGARSCRSSWRGT